MLSANNVTSNVLCWNMISIEIKDPNRTLDLIVTRQADMDILISYLLTQMKLNQSKQSMKLKKQILKVKGSESIYNSKGARKEKLAELKQLKHSQIHSHEKMVREGAGMLKYYRIARI